MSGARHRGRSAKNYPQARRKRRRGAALLRRPPVPGTATGTVTEATRTLRDSPVRAHATAAVPGRPAPKLIPASAVERMRPGSVIVDLAAETGGNCELTRPGETIDVGGVSILGPLNLASSMPAHASQLYARNISALLGHLAPEGELVLDWDDEITAGACVTRKAAVA